MCLTKKCISCERGSMFRERYDSQAATARASHSHKDRTGRKMPLHKEGQFQSKVDDKMPIPV